MFLSSKHNYLAYIHKFQNGFYKHTNHKLDLILSPIQNSITHNNLLFYYITNKGNSSLFLCINYNFCTQKKKTSLFTTAMSHNKVLVKEQTCVTNLATKLCLWLVEVLLGFPSIYKLQYNTLTCNNKEKQYFHKL